MSYKAIGVMDGLLDKLEIELKSRGFSAKTIKSYVFHTSCFLKRMGMQAEHDEIQRYFAGLSEKMDPRTVNLRISAVKFFYRNVLGREMAITFLKRPKRIPEALTKNEVQRIITAASNTKHRLIIETIYGCGLRVSEAAKLKKDDIRFEEGILFVRQGKGNKDRIVSLPFTLSKRLESYILLRNDENPYVFDSSRGGRLTEATIEKIVDKAAGIAGIIKNVHPHILRHSYATHLLENGTDIHIIQKLLGHSDVRTTEMYTHVSTALIKNIRSPLDTLASPEVGITPQKGAKNQQNSA